MKKSCFFNVGLLVIVLQLFMSCAGWLPDNSEEAKDSASESLFIAANMNYKAVEEANPLKGFFPFRGNAEANTIPYSMEFLSIPMKKVYTAENTLDYSAIEAGLNDIKSRGKQTVLRFYLDCPEEVSACPDFFWKAGIEKIYYTYDDGKQYYFPDYTDDKTISYIVKFIELIGKKYNGDSRIGFIFCGIVGHWGEWHNWYVSKDVYGSDKKMPSSAQQEKIFKAFSENLSKTYCLTRRASIKNLSKYSNIGFHDDSFIEDTFNDDIGWYFWTEIKEFGLDSRWQTAPIGGEFFPPAQLAFLNGEDLSGTYQDYYDCVKETHCSWLLCDKVFVPSRYSINKDIAKEASLALGYDLSLTAVEGDVKDNKVNLSVSIKNNGVAPFYYNWKPVLIVLNSKNEMLDSIENPFSNWKLNSIMEEETKTFDASISLKSAKEIAGSEKSCKIVLLVKNPMEGGINLKFANDTLGSAYKDAVTLGTIEF